MKFASYFTFFMVLAAGFDASAQVPSHIDHTIDDSRRVVLSGSVHRLVQGATDHGVVSPSLAMDHLVMTLKRTPEQQEALDAYLAELQDSDSPNYRKWLDAGEFGRRFGAADQDIQIVSAWLMTQGFQIEEVAGSRMSIRFSGTAERVQRAFHTEIHHISVNGEPHIANLTDPEIPEALAPVIDGIASLNDFYPQPAHVTLPLDIAPAFLMADGAHWLSPSDYAKVYNIKPLYDAGINGTGSTIAVLGRVRINMNNVANFRSVFGLPKNSPKEILAGPDPGPAGPLTGASSDNEDQTEITLDLSWSGAVAPKANLKYVFSGNSTTTPGLFLAAQYAIENKNKDVNADIISLSYGACEADSPSFAKTFYNLTQQAAAAGIAFVVSTGDSGSAGCDPASAKTATNGVGVNYMASSPYTTAIGGTMFLDTMNASDYWTSKGGANGYVPEKAWSESCAASESNCSDPNIIAGGGGASTMWTKPSWQAGVTGIPASNHRYIPDVSLAASSWHDPYMLCFDSDCQGGDPTYHPIGGTSAAAPSFAGMLALVKQKNGKLGSVNPVLYGLAANEKYSLCNGSAGAPASTCVFNDITVGSNAVAGEAGFGTSSQTYNTGVGFDLATGLGSVNALNLVNQWKSTKYSPTTTSLTLSTATIPANGSATLTLTASTGKKIATLTLSSGTATSTIGDWPTGSYTVSAQYSGDTTFAASTSAAEPLKVDDAQPVQPEITSITPGVVRLGQAVTITVNGSNFKSGLSAYIYISELDTYYPMTVTSVTGSRVEFGVTMNGSGPYTAYVMIVNPGGLWSYGSFDVAN
jgi:subtilase family serine protease